MTGAVSLRAYTVNMAGDRWRYRVEARGGALVADVPTFELALKWFIRWADADDQRELTVRQSVGYPTTERFTDTKEG